ncbi:MAG: hypothetical protein L0154_09705 [Chloroflexi bacterium]|nr:hypothetical protein [Chloroflexota bacterium]
MRKLFLVLLLTAIIYVPASAKAQTGPQGTIDVDNPVVQIMKLGTRQWIAPNQFTDIQSYDRIRTLQAGVGTITWFEESSQLRLTPETEIVVESFSGSANTFTLDVSLIYGSVLSYVPDPVEEGSSYQIWTPYFIVGTPGESIFHIAVDHDFNTTIGVLTGSLNLTSYDTPDESTEIEEGTLVTIDLEGEVSDAEELDDTDEDFEDFITALAEFEEEVTAEPEDEEDGTGTPEDEETGTPEDEEETATPEDEDEETVTPEDDGGTATPEDDDETATPEDAATETPEDN